MTKINKRTVDAARAADAEWFLWDSKLKGFGLRVRPSGRKFYIAQYRFKGRTRRLMLGEHGRVTPDQARSKAFAALNAVEHDEDPAQARDLDRKAITLKDFVETVYLPDAEKGLVTYRGNSKKVGTLSVDRGRINRHILPLLGNRKVRDLSASDITEFIEDVAAGKTAKEEKTKARGLARVTGGPGAARRTAGLLGGILSYAVTKRIRDDNPARGVDRRFYDKKRDRALTAEEFARLGKALVEAARPGNREQDEKRQLGPENLSAVAAIWFLALSGFRKSEALELRRQNIDAKGHFARLQDTKTGPQSRPLGLAAVETAESHPKGSGELVFWGTKKDRPFIGLPKVFARVCKAAKIEGASLHTLRHSFASVAAELGYSEFVIAGLLGHRAGSVTARYSHVPDSALTAAADRISQEIETRMAGSLRPRNQAGGLQ